MAGTFIAGSNRFGIGGFRASLARRATAGVAAGAAVNGAIWLAGAAAGVPFSVTIFLGGFEHHVSLLEVVLATAFLLAAGYGLLAATVRRAPRWAAVLVVAGVLFAVISAGGAIAAANDHGTGLLLAAMHLAAAGVFVVTTAGRTTRAGRGER